MRCKFEGYICAHYNARRKTLENRFENFLSITAEIQKCINRIKSEEMASLGLKSSHTLYIYYLYKHKRLSLTQLSKKCGADKAAVSRAIEYLKVKGYIENGDVGYKKPIRLTQKGEAAGASLNERIAYVLGITADGVSDGDRDVMYESLEKILVNLKSVSDSYKPKEENQD